MPSGAGLASAPVPAASAPLRVHTLIDSLSWGGAETLLADLAAGAPAAGIELSVGYLLERHGSPAAAALRERGVEPVHVGGGKLLDARALGRVRRHLRALAPDVVHTHLQMADVQGTLAARWLGIPAVSTLHLVAGQPTGTASDAGTRGRARARLAAFVRRRAGARVLAVSEAARRAYVATGWDVPSHVVTVHNGIARAAADVAAGAAVRAEFGIAPDALVVSTLTVLRPGKGHDLAVGAVRELLARFPRLRLLVCGDGPARDEIHRLAAPLGEAAIFAGHRADAMAVLAASDVLLHPTRMDAFPTALLEAAAARVPVVATAVGGIPEIVEDETTGLLLAPPPTVATVADAVGRLLGDAARRARLGAAAHAHFEEHFTAQRWATRLRAVYDEVLAERRA
jgi:glycosyltransferase involved in cell wall biosynthesis